MQNDNPFLRFAYIVEPIIDQTKVAETKVAETKVAETKVAETKVAETKVAEPIIAQRNDRMETNDRMEINYRKETNDRKEINDRMKTNDWQETNDGKEINGSMKPKRSQEEYSKHLSKKKQTIPKHVRQLVWNQYIGEFSIQHKCLCCKKVTIMNTNFEVGHVIPERNGGTLELMNLRPICSACNKAMGTMNMIDFVKRFGLYIG